MNEIERIKKAYEKRKEKQIDKIYSPFNIASLFISHNREKELLRILKKFVGSKLSDKRILDVGYGSGGY